MRNGGKNQEYPILLVYRNSRQLQEFIRQTKLNSVVEKQSRHSITVSGVFGNGVKVTHHYRYLCVRDERDVHKVVGLQAQAIRYLCGGFSEYTCNYLQSRVKVNPEYPDVGERVGEAERIPLNMTLNQNLLEGQ